MDKMIDSLYFNKEASEYAYELERLIRNFSLPHKLNIITDKSPEKDNYAAFSAENGSLSVKVAEDGRIALEEAFVSDEAQRENTLCSMLCRCMKRLGYPDLPWGILTGVRPIKFIRSIYEKIRPEEKAEKYIKEVLLVSGKKLQLAKDVIRLQKPVLSTLDLKKISLYISVPFCP